MYSDKIKQLNSEIDDLLEVLHECDLTSEVRSFYENVLDKTESQLAKYITLEVYYLVKDAHFI